MLVLIQVEICGVFMKYIALSLLVFVCFSQAGFCDTLSSQSKFSSKINLQGASDVTKRANEGSSLSSPYSDAFQDPMLNSMMQGMGNMIQGCNVDARMMQEQNKQQMDYAKQQFSH